MFCEKSFSAESQFGSKYAGGGCFVIDRCFDKAACDKTRAFYENKIVEKARYDRFCSQVKSWSEKGITVIGVYIPMCDEFVNIQEHCWNRDEAIAEFKNAGGIWVEVPGNYDTVDGAHLTAESAYRYSEALAKELKKVLNLDAK